MKKEEVNKQIKEVVRPNGKGEINGNNLQETLLLMNNNAANDEDTASKLNLKANQKETDEKLALKADKTSVYTKEEANALLDLKVNIKDYEEDKEVSNKEKQELDIKLTQTKQELDSVKSSLSHMGNGVVGEAKGGSVISLPSNAMSSVAPNYRIEGLTDVEGTKSVQLPMRVKSVGENLWNGKFVYGYWDRGGFVKGGNTKAMNKLFEVQEGKTYYISLKDYSGYPLSNLWLFNERKVGVKQVVGVGKVDIPQGVKYIAGHTGTKEISVDSNLKIELSETKRPYKPYTESITYINNQLELKSVGEVKDYIENGILYKNISDDGEILEKTEVVNLSTSGLIEANPNGTIFLEPITNITGFYDNGLDVEGLDILRVEEFSHLVNGVYQNLDISKVKVEGGKLTHPDAQNGIVYLVYRYDDNAVWGENTISYYNSDKTLKSPNGKIWKKVETATDTGELLVTLEEVK